MKEFELFYGDGSISLDLSGFMVKKILEAKPLPRNDSEKVIIENALTKPLDSAPLSQLVNNGEKACIIIGDMTRAWARHNLLLPPLLHELNRGGISDRDIFIISATGDHREQTVDEHRTLVGDEAYSRVKIYDHRARDEDSLVYLGDTFYGTPVYVNKLVTGADRVILTGGIVYHFLAGWGGGKKAIIPGVAGYNTIMKNHSLAFYPEEGRGLNPAVSAGKIDGNPCCDDMIQGASFIAPDFLINTIINEETHKIAYVVAGNYLTAHRAGCDLVANHYGIIIDEHAEVVIASCGGYPKDINFYQAYKTIYNAHFALRKGGTMLLVSECREGIGSNDFLAPLLNLEDNQQREAALRRKYTIGSHMGYHAGIIASENDILVISGLDDFLVEKMGMIPIANLDEALNFINKKHGSKPWAYIIPHGGSIMPFIDAS